MNHLDAEDLYRESFQLKETIASLQKELEEAKAKLAQIELANQLHKEGFASPLADDDIAQRIGKILSGEPPNDYYKEVTRELNLRLCAELREQRLREALHLWQQEYRRMIQECQEIGNSEFQVRADMLIATDKALSTPPPDSSSLLKEIVEVLKCFASGKYMTKEDMFHEVNNLLSRIQPSTTKGGER